MFTVFKLTNYQILGFFSLKLGIIREYWELFGDNSIRFGKYTLALGMGPINRPVCIGKNP